MGSPIGVAATTVDDACRMAKYMKPCPIRVGMRPNRSKPPNSIDENPVRGSLVKKEIAKRVMVADVNRVRE